VADEERFPGSHQESIATAIALIDDENSNLIANLVEPGLFDSPYDDVVSRCVEHRKAHKRPPGKGHIDDVFAHVLEDRQHKAYNQYNTIISKMVQQADRLDTGYVLEAVSKFVYQRRYRLGIAKLVERYQKGGDALIDELDELSRQNLKIREVRRDYGFSLADDRALGFLERDARDYCNIGVKELDERGVVPTRKELLAFLSPPNRGKSAFLVHCGKFALLKGWKVAHYSLENSEDMTAQRYFQSLFNGVRRRGTYRFAELNQGKDGVVKLTTETLTPDFVIEDVEDTYAFLNDKMKDWKRRLANLRIRRFPSGRLSFDMLERDLDDLKALYKFEPDLLMVDMPQLMKLPRREKDYSALDELFTDLRGLAVERNLALVAPQQGNRGSNSAKSVQAQHGAGSFGVFGIADNLITYSQTASEEARGLARLYTQKVRNDRARTTILITQHYDSGQFVMSSHPMNSRLRDEVSTYVGYKAGEGDDEEDDEYETAGKKKTVR
jgi:hypothetical protein